MKNEYDFTEIFKLRFMLDKANIKYVFKDDGFVMSGKKYTGYHIWCYEKNSEDNWFISIIQNFGSYGREQDLLEIMGLLTNKESKQDGVVGYLTAENVFKRIKKYLKKQDEPKEETI